MGLKVVGPPAPAVVTPVNTPKVPAPVHTPAPAAEPMQKPEFSTPARQDPATAKGLAATVSVPSSALKRNLWHAQDVNAQLSQLASANKFSTMDEIDQSVGAIPAMLLTRVTLFGQGVLAKLGAGPDMSKHAPGPKVVDPTKYYAVARHIGELSRENGFGNCGDKAMSAAAMMADRGLFPVEVFMLDGRDGDHGFCVAGRALLSDPADPSTWGPDAVVVDPWSNEAYPVAELVADPSAKMRGLIPAGAPRFERFALVAGADPNPE